MLKLDEIIRRFVFSEGKFTEPSLKSYLQALEETLNKIGPKSMPEIRRVEIAKEQLKGVRRHVRRLEEAKALLETQNQQLTERLSLLEETKDKAEE